MKVYIAAALANAANVEELQNQLEDVGIFLTYNWASRHREKLDVDSQAMLEAVISADLFVLYGTGGRGAHVELGVAIASRKPILICVAKMQDPIVFYNLPEIKVMNPSGDIFLEIVKTLIQLKR